MPRFTLLIIACVTYFGSFVHAQQLNWAGQNVHLTDSTQIYFFDLFDDKRAMDWGVVPKNFPFTNYRIYLRNNSLDTLNVGRVTTSDGRVTYHYSSRTRTIYPNEYVVLKPLHNGTQIRHRHGRFSRSVQITLHSDDTTYYAYHRYIGAFSTDTTLPNYTRIDPEEPLLPLRKVQELDKDRALVAKTNEKMEAMGKERIKFVNPNDPGPTVRKEPVRPIIRLNETKEIVPTALKEQSIASIKADSTFTVHVYVFFLDSLISGPGQVYAKTANRMTILPLETTEIPHYVFQQSGTDSLRRILLRIDHNKRLPLNLACTNARFIYANYNGSIRYFFTQDSCERYIQKMSELNTVAACFRYESREILTVSEVQVLDQGRWKSLTRKVEDDRIAFPYTTSNRVHKIRLRWKKNKNAEWQYDWLFMKRGYHQIFRDQKKGTHTLYTASGKIYKPVQENIFEITVKDSNFSHLETKELSDSIRNVLQWYGIDVEQAYHREIRLKSPEDRFRVNRALKKHFASCRMSPVLRKEKYDRYSLHEFTVQFYAYLTDKEIEAFLNSAGIQTFMIRKRLKEPLHPVSVVITLDDVISPSSSQKLEKIYHSDLVYSIENTVYILDFED